MSRAPDAVDTRTATMHAARVVAPGEARIETAPIPEPGPGEVRVRLEGCGVCGSNGPLWEGRPWFEYPAPAGAPGHEGWGRVDAVGPGVRRLAEGDRVTLLSYRAFAEYDVAPEDCVVPLPESLGSLPFPGEALGCAVNVFRRSALHAGESVAVVGVGFLGALLVQLASRAGCRVTALSRRPFALETARTAGAEEAIAIAPDAAARARGRTGDRGFECVIEAAGTQGALDLAGELTSERGRLVIAGYHQDGPRQVNMQLWNWRGLDVVNAHERDTAVYVSGMRTAVELVLAGTLDIGPLLTHTFPLADLGRALDAMRERDGRFLKALVLA
jgi:threonine dehydrogenase-like Zn-dependent dehydrogenase